jgi:hypothetical protein
VGHQLTDETMATFVGKKPGQIPMRFAIQAGYDKLRRCAWCQAFLEPGYAAMTTCALAPAPESSPFVTFFPEDACGL